MPAPTEMYTVFFSAETLDMARPTAEFTPPSSRSTLFTSTHSRALVEAMSGLFWWSTNISSIFLPPTWPPKSAMAMRTASTPPAPSMSENRPDMSVAKPILTVSCVYWACAGTAAARHRAAP